MKYPPIVILHGWNLSAQSYTNLVNLLSSKGFTVYVPDFPGFGKEKLPQKPYNTDNYVEFLESYLNKKNIKKCIIIGHSFGGRVGIKFIAKNPETVEKLILTGVPGVTPSSKTKILVFRFLAKVGKAIFSLPLLNVLFPLARKVLYQAIKETDYFKTEGVMRETFKKIISEDLTFAMNKITCPTILVWGEKDMITPVWIAKKMARLIGNSELMVVHEEGHSFIYKNPELFVKEFINYVK